MNSGFGIGLIELLMVFGMFGGILIIPTVCFWKIFEKAGFSPWLSLGFLLPVVNVALLLFLAFSDWPALKGNDRSAEF
jgi:hypothetical protein